MTGTYDEIQRGFEGELVGHPSIGPIAEMTDGLPVTPPTEDRVAKSTNYILEFPQILIIARFLSLIDRIG